MPQAVILNLFYFKLKKELFPFPMWLILAEMQKKLIIHWLNKLEEGDQCYLLINPFTGCSYMYTYRWDSVLGENFSLWSLIKWIQMLGIFRIGFSTLSNLCSSLSPFCKINKTFNISSLHVLFNPSCMWTCVCIALANLVY